MTNEEILASWFNKEFCENAAEYKVSDILPFEGLEFSSDDLLKLVELLRSIQREEDASLCESLDQDGQGLYFAEKIRGSK